jgi:hypothetical protein
MLWAINPAVLKRMVAKHTTRAIMSRFDIDFETLVISFLLGLEVGMFG